MVIQATWEIRLIYDDEVITNSGTLTKDCSMEDDLKHIKRGPARGTAAINEKVSGPEGTYSAMELSVGAEMACAQTKTDIALAQTACLNLCREVLDEVFDDQYDKFVEHAKKGRS